MNTKKTVQAMDNNYYTTTTTFGDIKFKYILTK
jgi:hypothetical protein